jgi:uncharacterized membrane protein YcjF (UPF0283 family)
MESGKMPQTKEEQSATSPEPKPGRPIRRGDTGLGQPVFEPEWRRTLSEEETARYEAERKKAEEEEDQRKFAEKVRELGAQSESWLLPPALRRTLSWVLVGVAAVLGLFLVAQASSLASTIVELPVPFNWLAGASAILFAAILLYIIGRMFWMVVRLNRSPALHLHALETLRERAEWQRLARERTAQAKEKLVQYLQDYPTTPAHGRRLIAAGMTEKEHQNLLAAREWLLSGAPPMTPENWLDEFRIRFQSIQDDAARRRVMQYAKRTGLGTAVMPIPTIDQMIVFYACFAMIKELLQLYNLRPAFGQTATILARSIILTYLSGLMEEVTESATEAAGETFSETAIGPFLTNAIGSKFMAKATEGTLNGILIFRLGRRTIMLLQPVRGKRR